MSRDVQQDVLISGGGPAGAAAAIVLARSNRRVTLLEKSRGSRRRFGETLPPNAQLWLRRLDVWDSFLATNPTTSPGNVAHWGGGSQATDFICSPFGVGWHIDRQRFDAMLLRAAQRSGAVVRLGTRLHKCRRTDSGWEHTTVDERGTTARSTSRVLLEATGRASSGVLARESKRNFSDCMVGIVGFGRTSAKGTTDHRTLVEATEDGWWYSSPLPERGQVSVFLTDRDLIPVGRSECTAFWISKMGPQMRKRVGSNPDQVSFVPANTCWRQPVVGKDWLAVGDASWSCDPLSGQGVSRAIRSGSEAAEAINNSLEGKSCALEEFAQSERSQRLQMLRQRSYYYGQEQRWPRAPFWKRRHKPGIQPASISLHPASTLAISEVGVAELSGWPLASGVTDRLSNLDAVQQTLLMRLARSSLIAHQLVASHQAQTSDRLSDRQVIIAIQSLIRSGLVMIQRFGEPELETQS